MSGTTGAAAATRGERALAHARAVASEGTVARTLERLKTAIEGLDATASNAPDRITENYARFVEKRKDILDSIRGKDSMHEVRDYLAKYNDQSDRLMNRVIGDREDYVDDFVRAGRRDDEDTNKRAAKKAFGVVKNALLALDAAVEASAQTINSVA